MSESNCEQTNAIVNVTRKGKGRAWEVKKPINHANRDEPLIDGNWLFVTIQRK
jgi:hypothetical protein